MRNIFNLKFFFFLVLLISILIVVKIDIFQILNSKTYVKTKHLFPNKLKHNIKNSNYFKFIYTKLMTITANKKFSNKNILEIRNLILNKYILDPKQITYFEKPGLIESIKFNTFPDESSKIIGVNFYKINNYSIIEYSKYHSKKKKLLIYNQGHKGNPYNFDYFINIKEHYKQKGFDIMSLSMSNMGYNEESVSFPLIDLESDQHAIYHKFYDEKYPNKKPLSLMLSGNYYLIKKILSDYAYEEIYMIGVSGGGWYTTFLSSIIPEIKTSYSFAGTFPLVLRIFEDKGDWEQSESRIFEKIDYWDLYLLSTIDQFNKQNRKHFQVYNKDDPCCFRDPFTSIMKGVSDKLENPNFKVVVLNIDKHIVDTNFLFSQF